MGRKQAKKKCRALEWENVFFLSLPLLLASKDDDLQSCHQFQSVSLSDHHISVFVDDERVS